MQEITQNEADWLTEDNYAGEKDFVPLTQSLIKQNPYPKKIGYLDFDDISQEIIMSIYNRNLRAIKKARDEGSEGHKKMKLYYTCRTFVDQAHMDIMRRETKKQNYDLGESDAFENISTEVSYMNACCEEKMEELLDEVGFTPNEIECISRCLNSKSKTCHSVVISKLIRHMAKSVIY